MSKVAILGFLLGVGILYFVFRNQANAAFASVIYYSPCDSPIKYSIGTIDPGFKTSKEELKTDAKIASNVWSATQNKPLFEYDPKASFTINLVYDSRQQLTSKITEMNSTLKEKQGEIDPKLKEYKKRQASFEARVKKLNEEIKSWNEKGGAPQEDYERLLAEQKSLQAEAQALNNEAQSLGQKTSEYNSSAKKLNQEIDNYQDVLITKPEEGLYEQDGRNRKISIFIDVDHEEFLHTLTHEMGHALGLDHNIDKESIMYPQTTDSLTPSATEIEELNSICKQRTVFEVVYRKTGDVYKVLKKRFEDSTS